VPLLDMAYRLLRKFRQASTRLDTPPFSNRRHPGSDIALNGRQWALKFGQVFANQIPPQAARSRRQVANGRVCADDRRREALAMACGRPERDGARHPCPKPPQYAGGQAPVPEAAEAAVPATGWSWLQFSTPRLPNASPAPWAIKHVSLRQFKASGAPLSSPMDWHTARRSHRSRRHRGSPRAWRRGHAQWPQSARPR